MNIGELVETLIRIRDDVEGWENKDALADACNILDELPREWTAEETRVMFRWLHDNSRIVRAVVKS